MSPDRLPDPLAALLASPPDLPVVAALDRLPLRDHVSPSATYPLQVDRTRALAGSWYEIFPRSLGSSRDADGTMRTGTLRTAAQNLDRIAAMGFDVLYLTPVSPIGTTNRKGHNNTLVISGSARRILSRTASLSLPPLRECSAILPP